MRRLKKNSGTQSGMTLPMLEVAHHEISVLHKSGPHLGGLTKVCNLGHSYCFFYLILKAICIY